MKMQIANKSEMADISVNVSIERCQTVFSAKSMPKTISGIDKISMEASASISFEVSFHKCLCSVSRIPLQCDDRTSDIGQCVRARVIRNIGFLVNEDEPIKATFCDGAEIYDSEE